MALIRTRPTVMSACCLCLTLVILYLSMARLRPTSNVKRESDYRAAGLNSVPNGLFNRIRKPVIQAQEFAPVVIPVHRDPKFNYKRAMKELNEAKVAEDDPRLIKLIRDYYLEPPSSEPYNLELPNTLDYSMGQAPIVDAQLDFIEGGFYVEAGALNGERGSNTLYFEKVRKWNGLLVEADPSNFAKLKTKHRKAYMINACLSDTTYPSVLTFEQDFNLGRIVQDGMKPQKKTAQVQCFSLYSLLLALNRTTVDFLSLDVEGAEMGVLKTIPFDKVNIKTMTVEYKHDEGGYKPMQTFMESKGYKSLMLLIRFDDRANDILFRKTDFKSNNIKAERI